MHQVRSKKQAHAINVGLLISLLLFVACSGSGPEAAQSTEFETRVAVAVKETVSALANGPVTAGAQEQVAASSQVDQSVLADQPAGEVAAAPADNSRTIVDYLLANGRHFIGNPNADVVIIEFSDFQCPYCRRFATGTWPQVKEEFVDTDEVLFGYMHLATLGRESTFAAAASECAAEQGRFWDYHDLLYERAQGANSGTFSKEGLKSLGAELGINIDEFDECVDSERTLEIVYQDGAIANELVIRGTPTFAINGRSAVGSMPVENFRLLVERARDENPYVQAQ